jgi:hypothetical protein
LGEGRKNVDDLIQVLNLGAGVQSTTVLLMSLEGELPPLDHVVFADTGWEPRAVYEHLEWLQTLTKVEVVSAGNIRHNETTGQLRGTNANGSHATTLPYFTITDGGDGMIKRQCTYNFKIRPIERFIRRTVLGLQPRQRAPKVPTIRQWYGISLDEHQRMAKNPNKWTVNYYPLIEKRMTRRHCLEWLEKRGVTAPRSACIACPFKHNSEWRLLRDGSPDEWQDAVEFDAAIRKCGGMRGDLFVHADRVPLDLVDLSTDVDRGQLLFGWMDECEGMCGV